jgi:cysteinyl-tRNA synthetase
MSVKIFNTASKTLEEIRPRINSERVRFYSCGPTVYGYAHIGNLRSFISADLLVRALELDGQSVQWVMNLTDVDDKTIAGAIAKYGPTANTSNLREYTHHFAEAFFADLKKVGIGSSGIEFVSVSDVIPEIQKFILRLLELGYAYKAEDGSIYFSIEKYQETFGDYGSLVGKKFMQGITAGARVAVDEYDKENLSDFALWKSHSPADGGIYWDHPVLGRGRPGWHIECTLINYMKFHSGTDIHSGGVDLIFPHHTNEIAQAAPVYKPHVFVSHWMHSEHIMVDGKKMSKSLGNFWTIEDLESRHIGNGQSLRFLMLQSHYRTKLNVTEESLIAAQNGLRNIHNQTEHIASHMGEEFVPTKEESAKIIDNEFTAQLRETLNDDLNTPIAMAIIPEILKSKLPNRQKLLTLMAFEKALGLVLITSPAKKEQVLPDEVQKLVRQRNKAREQKDYALSDSLRLQIEQLGYEVSDTLTETKVSRK